MAIDNRNHVIAFDLDGTLIDSSRRQDGTLDFWRANSTPAKIAQDKLMPLHEIFHLLKEDGYFMICVTARVMSDYDHEFLVSNDLIFDEVLSRRDDLEANHVLKHFLLKEFFNRHLKVPKFAFDDEHKNLDVFRSFGFQVHHPDNFLIDITH